MNRLTHSPMSSAPSAYSTPTSPPCAICNTPAVFFAVKNNHTLYRCPHCRLIFVFPLSVSAQTIYTQDYFTGAEKGFGYVHYDEDKEAMTSTFNVYLDRIEDAAPAKGSLLDVGAATGFFLNLAKKRGWETSGVEISDFAAETGRKKGLAIRTGTLSEAGFTPGSFDVITLWDVIEHVPSPENEIEAATTLLKPGGILAVNTPDAGSAVARILGKRWHAFVPPEHLFYFNPSNFDQLLSRHHLRPICHTKIGKRFTVQYIVKTLSHWPILSFLKPLVKKMQGCQIAEWSIPLNLRDNFFVLGQKYE